tara:strand:+ start:236 stop:835 length:600 start_codon:yes stop_codon:yes gene_type:complete
MFEKSDFNLYEIPVNLPVFSTIFDDYLEFNKYLKESIIEHREKHPQSNRSNVKSWHSAWNTHKINSKFKPLTDRVENACGFISNEYYGTPCIMHVNDLWVMMYDEGDYANKHHHYPSILSSIYYVDVEPTSSPIIFENDFGKSLTIHPQNGMLLIWASSIMHMVFPTLSKRMLISMNINTPRLNGLNNEPNYSASDRVF